MLNSTLESGSPPPSARMSWRLFESGTGFLLRSNLSFEGSSECVDAYAVLRSNTLVEAGCDDSVNVGVDGDGFSGLSCTVKESGLAEAVVPAVLVVAAGAAPSDGTVRLRLALGRRGRMYYVMISWCICDEELQLYPYGRLGRISAWINNVVAGEFDWSRVDGGEKRLCKRYLRHFEDQRLSKPGRCDPKA